MPSSKPMKTIENPIDFKYIGIIGYSISLAASVHKLIIDKTQTVFEMEDKVYLLIPSKVKRNV
jgi:hypothetical protein